MVIFVVVTPTGIYVFLGKVLPRQITYTALNIDTQQVTPLAKYQNGFNLIKYSEKAGIK